MSSIERKLALDEFSLSDGEADTDVSPVEPSGEIIETVAAACGPEDVIKGLVSAVHHYKQGGERGPLTGEDYAARLEAILKPQGMRVPAKDLLDAVDAVNVHRTPVK